MDVRTDSLSDGESSNKEASIKQIPTFSEAFWTWKVWRVALYAMLIAFSIQLPNIVAPTIGSDWFNDNDAKYSYWNGIFVSISGIFGFLTQGYIGKMSDIYGRKPLMIFVWCTIFFSVCWLTLTKNIWYYLVLLPFGEMNGSFGSIPTVLQASLADVIHPEHRTMAFGVLFGVAGIVVIVASVATALIEDYYGTQAAIFVFDISMIITLLYLIFVYKETLTVEKQEKNRLKYHKLSILRKENEIKNRTNCIIICLKRIFEPLSPLLKMKDNKLIFWFGIIALFVGLPESGVDDLLSVYCFKMLNLTGDNTKTTFTSEATIVLGISMLVSQLLFLPIITKCLKNDVLLIMVALLTIISFGCCGVLLYFFSITPIAYVSLSI